MKIINLNQCPLSRKNGMYGGAAGMKDGILYNNEEWMVKYPKNISDMERTGEASYSTTPLSEYLGSHVYEILGYETHQTFLGERNNKIVVACKDFAVNDDLLEIRTIKNHGNPHMEELFEREFNNTGSSHCVELEDLLLHIKYNPILSEIKGIEERFWEQAIVDIFINNNDRNNGNWGVLRDRDGRDRLAPVFDNGGAFQSKMSEEKIRKLLSEAEKTINNASNTQTAYGKNGHVFSSAKFLSLAETNRDFQNAIIKVVPTIKKYMTDIVDFVQNIPETHTLENGKTVCVCSTARKQLFIMQMSARFENLLLPAYERIIEKNISKQITAEERDSDER